MPTCVSIPMRIIATIKSMAEPVSQKFIMEYIMFFHKASSDMSPIF